MLRAEVRWLKETRFPYITFIVTIVLCWWIYCNSAVTVVQEFYSVVEYSKESSEILVEDTGVYLHPLKSSEVASVLKKNLKELGY